MNNFINGYQHYTSTLPLRKALLLLLIGILTACSARTHVHENQHTQQSANNADFALVYFIRPTPTKFKGISDNAIYIDYNNTRLLTVNEGRYALVKLKASEGPMTTHSQTMFTNQDQPIKVTRTRQYRFIAGKTYFIHLKRIDEEFRGIFYDPAPVTLDQAKQLAKGLSPYGNASDAPIKNIVSVDEPKLASPLEPVMPEQLYPGHKYLIKGTPTYTPPSPPSEKRNEMNFDQAPSEPINRKKN